MTMHPLSFRCLLLVAAWLRVAALASTVLAPVETCLVGGTCRSRDESVVAETVPVPDTLDRNESGYDDDDDDEEVKECSDNDDKEENEPYDPDCLDTEEKCLHWFEDGGCKTNPEFMQTACPKSCKTCYYGVRQLIESDEAQVIVDAGVEYMEDVVLMEELYEDIRYTCRNRDSKCSYWASIGECEANRPWMEVRCAVACKTCEATSLKLKCPIDPNMPNAFAPGDLNKMFERITTLPQYQKYEPQILSGPASILETRKNPMMKKRSRNDEKKEKEDHPDRPWVVVLDTFVTPEECDALIENGKRIGFERSILDEDDGSVESELSTYRTSKTAWCDDDCEEDPLVKSVIDKMEYLTGVPVNNYEDLQLLYYEEGQYYKSHNDYIEDSRKSPPGVRVLTVFLYLNDVEEGGGTGFTDLNMTVYPKRGRAVIWPSVLDEDPHEVDDWTNHEAMKVIKGVKYGANAWLHQRVYWDRDDCS